MSGIIKALGYFILLTFFVFAPFFLKGQIPFPGNYLLAWFEPWRSEHTVNGIIAIVHKPVVDDAIRHLYPLRQLALEDLKKFKWPLWNPYNAGGTPLLAIMHPGYFNPFGFTYFIFSEPRAWSLYIILQITVLGLGHFIYCRALKLSSLASIFSATVLLLSGFVIVRLEYGEFIYVLSVLPLLLTIVERLRQVERTKIVLAVPVLTLFLFLSGQPQMIVYVLGISGLYALVRLWRKWTRLIKMVLFTFLGFGLSAFQLLPSLELYLLSTISHQSSQFIFERFLLPLPYLVTILIPSYFGNQATYNYFAVGRDYVETMGSVGLMAIFFAILAITKKLWKSDKPIAFFALMTVLTLASALNWFGARFIFSIPIPVLSADVPSRVFGLTTFCLAVLAGFGFEHWLKSARVTDEIKVKTISYLSILGVLAVVTLILFLTKYPCPTPNISVCRLISLRNAGIEILAFTLFLLAFWTYFHFKKLKQILVAVPIVLVVLLGLYNAHKFLPFSQSQAIFPSTPVLAELSKVTGLDRFFGLGQANFQANVTTQFKLFSPEYFEPLHVRRYAELINFANTGNLRSEPARSDVLITNEATTSAAASARRERLLDLLSVKYLVFSQTEMPLTDSAAVVWQDGHWYIKVRLTSLPRAYLVSDYEVEKDDGKLLHRLFAPSFDPREQVLLEESPEASLVGPNSGSIKVNNYQNETVSLQVKSSKPAIVVLTDTFYPGWQARLDGRAVKIYRANYTFRAVVVPAGVHTVNFNYQPDSLRWGIIVSLAAVVSLIIVSTLVLRSGL